MNMKNPLLPIFDKCIEITNDVDDFRMLQLKVYTKRKEESSCAALRKEILTLIPAR
jgi:hypothetical protein